MTNLTPAPELWGGALPGEAAVEELPGPTTGQAISSHILLLENVIMRIANRITEKHGLTYAQWTALSCISHEGKTGITHGELGERLMVSKAPITAIVDRLERAKLVKRVADKRDRRVSRVLITQHGLETWDKARLDMSDYAPQAWQGISEAEQQMVLPLLARLLDNLAQDDPIAAPSRAPESA